MAREKKQFCPHIYAEWGELFDAITDRERSEILLAITKFPEYEPENISIWNFIKSQLQKDYELFVEKCEKNGEISRNYWQNKKTNDTERNRTDTERIPNVTEGHPKLKQKLLTKTETENINSMFDNFYNKYPKKIAKQKAFNSFKKSIEKTTFENLMIGLKNYLNYIEINKIDKQYIKHPATWLNQGCWEDEYDNKNETNIQIQKEIDFIKQLEAKDNV